MQAVEEFVLLVLLDLLLVRKGLRRSMDMLFV